MQPDLPFPGGVLLGDIARMVRRFVVVDDAQADTLALWVAHTHAFEAFSCTPYLTITSPEKRSGKTRLLEVLELLVREPLPTANISDAALFRVIDKNTPTLLIDEIDGIFGSKSREREELRGLLNAGYRRGAVAHRMGGSNNTTLQSFHVYSPKAFAGIGDCLPNTIVDRAIPIRLKRRTRDEEIERFRLREVEPEGHELRDRLADWLSPQRDYLTTVRPDLPDALDDRAQDVWEPLLAIAELAGDDWPARAWEAAAILSTGEEREDDSLTARLLHDLHQIFESSGLDRFKTADLIDELVKIEESPWGDWNGRTITPQALSKLLRRYRIKTMTIRGQRRATAHSDGKPVRGYKREQFEDAFARVLGVTGVTGVTSESPSGAGCNACNACNAQDASTEDDTLPSVPGNYGFLDYLVALHRNGYITTDEALERERVHRLVLVARDDEPL